MALVAFTRVEMKGIRAGDIFGYWDLRAGDTAAPLVCPRYADKSIHMFGTWDGATIALQGGNDPSLAQFDDIYDYEGTLISQSAARKPWVILPNVFALKPVLSGGGAATAVRVAIIGRGEGV